MQSNAEQILAYAENAVVEDDALVTARDRAVDLGAEPVPPAVGSLLAMFARMVDAKTVVEVGTGAGVSGLWILHGMREDGVLTTIDSEPELQRAAKVAYRDAGAVATRARLINGRALDVLPRLADEGYDMVFVDATPEDHARIVVEAARLLRPGGVLVLHNALLGGRVCNPSDRNATVSAVRDAARAVSDDERLAPVVLPLGDGLLCAVRMDHAAH